jgi:membrane protein
VELIDRSLAIGAQALLALIPLLMLMAPFLPADWSAELRSQVREIVGIEGPSLDALQQVQSTASASTTQTGLLGLLVAVLSASAFARALQRMYARVWDLQPHRGLGALRIGVLWIVVWVTLLQLMALLLKALAGVVPAGVVPLALQVLVNTLIWWWTAHLLLGGRVPWRDLLPGALLVSVLLVLLSTLSRLFMPRYAALNLDQYGPLGVLFAVASWLVVFGGVLVVGTVVGHMLARSQRSPRPSPQGRVSQEK